MDGWFPNFVAGLTTLTIVVICVIVHYEGLRGLSRWATVDVLTPRVRVATLIAGQLVLHLIEIFIFAIGYYLLSQDPAYGFFLQEDLNITLEMHFVDQLYYSSVVYTTLGFGDVVPRGPIRLLTGVEAVTGLVLIAWSASFTYLKMQKYWGRD